MLEYMLYSVLVYSTAVILLPGGEAQNLSAGINKLALQLSADIESGEVKNFVWSPYSAHSALSQVLLGSGGVTQSELEILLGIRSLTTQDYSRLSSSLRAGNSTLKVSNLLALAEGFKPLTAFSQALQARFGSQLQQFNFGTQKSASVKKMNQFVAESTNGKIADVLTEDSVDELTRLILINAIYFKDVWKRSFNSKDTFKHSFRAPSGAVEADFMNAKMEVKMLESGDYSILELPYSDPNRALILILPKEGVSTSNILKNIQNIDYSIVRNERDLETTVTLPRFKVRDRTQLKALMQAAGARSVFSDAANLSGISQQQLKVTDAFQDAFLEVNEEGTEAAAATVVSIGLRAATRQPRQFFVNRPFVFIVYDYAERIPLFVGKIVNPVTSETPETRSGVSGTPTGQSQGRTPSAATEQQKQVCIKLLEDHANAFENVKLCALAEQRRLLEWLSKFRKVCDSSQINVNNFQAGGCEDEWCVTYRSKEQEWNNTFNRLCSGPSEQQIILCRQTGNNINTFNRLSCDSVTF